MGRFVICVVGLENKVRSDLSFESDIELITFRYSKIVVNRSQRVPGARNIGSKTGVGIARKGRNDVGTCCRDQASKLLRSCVARRKAISDRGENRKPSRIAGRRADRVRIESKPNFRQYSESNRRPSSTKHDCKICPPRRGSRPFLC